MLLGESQKKPVYLRCLETIRMESELMNIPKLIVYNNLDKNKTFDTMKKIAYGVCVPEDEVSALITEIISVSEKMGFKGDLWQDYLAYLIAVDENPYSVSCERRGYIEGSINDVAIKDMEILIAVINADLRKYDEENGTYLFLLNNFANNNEGEKYFNKRIRDSIINLSVMMGSAIDEQTLLMRICAFYDEIGVGKFGMFKAFRIKSGSDDKEAQIEPVVSVEHVYLDDIIGYEIQKKKLTDNTEAFLNGKKANNVLLFGDSGTGKSSSIKAILNEYYDKGLRMIEIYKHQFKDLSSVINQIKDRNYKFIIYMDDLSFEEFEIEYKFLKAVIEGGLEKRPDNVLIYATSNRRHLVREKFSDKEERDDDLHSRDTVQEKLSLSARFGVSIYYGSPDKRQFNEIVLGLARKNNIEMDEAKLLLEANKWEVSHGGLSGRNAHQFINYISTVVD